jgi:hypothetical protein
MKVDKNDPTEPNIVMESYNDGMVKRKSKGVPIRLVIATQIYAQSQVLSNMNSPKEAAKYALEAADALIEEHNNTFK